MKSHTTSNVKHVNGLRLVGHTFSLPLDYGSPEGEQIRVFAREVTATKGYEDLPWLVFFQGGPGFASPRPSAKDDWVEALTQTHRVLLLDQRGTGLSSPLHQIVPCEIGGKQDQADYLGLFRADNIIHDAECIRKALAGNQPWYGMGQSYGGFCLLTYLSFYPESLSGALITGGTACITSTLEENYHLTYQKVADKNRLYYHRYPDDIERIQKIARHLNEREVSLPSGGHLSPRRFQQLGWMYGASGGFEKMHFIIEQAHDDLEHSGRLNFPVLREIENQQPFDTNPIFCVLHESIYAQQNATLWTAERLRENYPEYNRDEPFFFTGEMIAPSMLDDYAQIRPWKEAAELIAAKEDWPLLYNMDVLKKNTVPVAAIAYYDDMYVPVELSEKTARFVGNYRLWVTNEWEHNGLGIAGTKIVQKLLEMLEDESPYQLRLS